MGRGVAQMVEYVPSKYIGHELTPTTIKNKIK
jgi:hypothetical protein